MARKTRFLLLDLNGTVHVGDDPTPGALDALRRLQKASQDANLNIRFCSNSSKESSDSLAQRLRKMGFEEDVIPRSALFTSLDACVELCKNAGHRPMLLLNPSAQSAFPDSTSFKPDASSAPKDLSPTQWDALKRCDSVLMGLAPGLMRHEWLDEAFRLLAGEYGEKAQLIGTHRAMYLRPGGSTSDGQPLPLSLGPGAFLAGLEAASGIDPSKTIIVGKPQPAFFAECLKGMGWSSQESQDSESEVWIVGDDAVQDLSIPIESQESNPLAGVTIRRALVQTGKYRPGDEKKVTPLPGSNTVDGVWGNFAEWVDWYLSK
ncbi:unnamed protein product [Sympodiomycopsis kandeliae]